MLPLGQFNNFIWGECCLLRQTLVQVIYDVFLYIKELLDAKCSPGETKASQLQAAAVQVER